MYSLLLKHLVLCNPKLHCVPTEFHRLNSKLKSVEFNPHVYILFLQDFLSVSSGKLCNNRIKQDMAASSLVLAILFTVILLFDAV